MNTWQTEDIIEMNIYLDNGYLDFYKISSCGCPFIMIIGGRATGKTFGALKYAVESRKEFIFMRRTQAQLEIIKRPEYSPFNALNRELNWEIETNPNSRYTGDITLGDRTLGHILALSTISNLRGFSSGAEYLIYDEFIPEIHEKPFSGGPDAEFTAFLNAYETINRNREIQGWEPVQCFLLSNSNSLKNPILDGFGLVDILERKKKNGKKEYINRERGIAVFMLDDSKISEQKRETALYKAAKDSTFYRMAISNDFSNDNPENIRSENLKEYNIMFTVKDTFSAYKHKSERKYYISGYQRGTPPDEYEDTKLEQKRIRNKYGFLYDTRMRKNIYFENYSLQIKFDNLFHL